MLKNIESFQKEDTFSSRIFNTFEIVTTDTNGTDVNDISRELKLYLCNTTVCDITITSNSSRRALSTLIVFSVSIGLTGGDLLENTLTGSDIQTRISDSLNTIIVFEVQNSKTEISMSYSGTTGNTTVYDIALNDIKKTVLAPFSTITIVKDVSLLYPPSPPPRVPPVPPLLPSPPLLPPAMPSPPSPPFSPPLPSPEPNPPPPPFPSLPEPSPPPPPNMSPSPPPVPPELPPSPPSLPCPPFPPPGPPSSPPNPPLPPKPPASPPLPPLPPPPPPNEPPPQSPNPPPHPPDPPPTPPSPPVPPSNPPRPPCPPSEPPSPPSPPFPPASPPLPPFSPPPPPLPPSPPPSPFEPAYIRPTGCDAGEYCNNYCCDLTDEDCSGQTCVVESSLCSLDTETPLPSQFKGIRYLFDDNKPSYEDYNRDLTRAQLRQVTDIIKPGRSECDVDKPACVCLIDFQYACNITLSLMGIPSESRHVQVLTSKSYDPSALNVFTCEYDPPRPPSPPLPPSPPPRPPSPPLSPPEPPNEPPPPFIPPSPPPPSPEPFQPPPPSPFPPPPPTSPRPSPPPPHPPPSPPPEPPPPPSRPPFPPILIFGEFVPNTNQSYIDADLVCENNDNSDPTYRDLYIAINMCNSQSSCKGIYSYECKDFSYAICINEGYATEENPLCSAKTINNVTYNKKFKFKIPPVNPGQTIYQAIAGGVGVLAVVGLLSSYFVQRNSNNIKVNKNLWRLATNTPTGTSVTVKYPDSVNLQRKFSNVRLNSITTITDNEWENVGNNININFNDYFKSNGKYYVPVVTVNS